jgi:DNA mismatch repair protein MutS2
LALGLLQTAARDVVERYHYSVDMILAVFCTWAVWRWLEPVYPTSAILKPRPPGFPSDPRPPGVMLLAGAAVLGGLSVIISLD